MRRLTRGRAATDDEAATQSEATSEPVGDATDAQPGESAVPADGSAEQPTAVPADGSGEQPAAVPGESSGEQPTAVPGEGSGEQPTAALAPAAAEERPRGRDLPAGVDAGRLASVPTSASRGRLRRRLRYLRAVREVLLRDLGGFYYEAHRSDGGAESHRRLLDVKAARLATLDTELRELESRLDESHAETVLREPGIGGTCPQCGELRPTEARFCSRCGSPVGTRPLTPVATPAAGPQPTPASGSQSTSGAGPETTASLWGRPRRTPHVPAPGPAAPPSAQRGKDETLALGARNESSPAAQPATNRAESPQRATSATESPQPATNRTESPQSPQPATNGTESPERAQPATNRSESPEPATNGDEST